jgi:hypothetical protein
MNTSLRIVASACKVEGLETIFVGVRHWDSLMRSQIFGLEETSLEKTQKNHDIQGFVTNKGKFVTREEAWIIADNAGQIIRRVGGDMIQRDGLCIGVLYSENLW